MNTPVEHDRYYTYLKERSRLGAFYRNYYLYPKISSGLTGEVLDFGCGIGDFLKFFSGTVGADINFHNVEYCRGLGLQAELIENGRTPFDDCAFDSIVMDNVLEHIPQQEVNGVIHEVLRVLRPGGRLLVGVPGMKGYASDPDHKCFYSEEDLIALLAHYGCIKCRSFHMPLHMPWLENKLSQYCIYVLFEKSQG
ncbi:methyltransferase domain-containing protein [Mariprofundus sp. EBB-1]|uniref:class I SAM-dependent methyltransferase n=1 Tax=Mariprofundus sp. EBB-1 TaxID=2650971 RepID=UPI000EF17D0D|nr:methyltransferase domain-containing protein [Mariprofundus sp. EBB-1]RLL50880.1 methyltransferase domain-containing protein [Mariprofundus sp. EBB-1]